MAPVSLLLLFLLLLPLVSAQTYRWGPCPTPKVQPNFNLQMYLGKWYEIEKLPANFEKGKCIEANYAMRADGTIQVLNSQIYKDKNRTGEGTAILQDINNDGRIGVSFSYFTPYSPYLILSTDYVTHSVIYSCTDFLRIFHVEFAWILGRPRFLEEKTILFAKNLLMKEGIDLSTMTSTIQTGCSSSKG